MSYLGDKTNKLYYVQINAMFYELITRSLRLCKLMINRSTKTSNLVIND